MLIIRTNGWMEWIDGIPMVAQQYHTVIFLRSVSGCSGVSILPKPDADPTAFIVAPSNPPTPFPYTPVKIDISSQPNSTETGIKLKAIQLQYYIIESIALSMWVLM